jgi:hypothetical protein
MKVDKENDFPLILEKNTYLNSWHKTDRSLQDPKIMFVIRLNPPESLMPTDVEKYVNIIMLGNYLKNIFSIDYDLEFQGC